MAFARFGSGILGGCDNETLNGLTVEFGTPYLIPVAGLQNEKEVAGTLHGFATKIIPPEDHESAAGGKSFNNMAVTAAFVLFTTVLVNC